MFVGGAEFPSLLKLKSNIDYVREVMKSVRNSAQKETILPLNSLSDTSDFFKYQQTVIGNVNSVASHKVIDKYIDKYGEDYRFEVDKSVIKELRDRKVDNTELARKKGV